MAIQIGEASKNEKVVLMLDFGDSQYGNPAARLHTFEIIFMFAMKLSVNCSEVYEFTKEITTCDLFFALNRNGLQKIPTQP